MSATASAVSREAGSARPWLHSRNWDLTFISLNVLLVTVPYLSYLLLLNLDGILGPIAQTFGSTVDDVSRNIVNATVALLIGGPHMYATFSRTALDKDYVKKHPRMIWTSLAIPVIVVTLALLNLQLLLTVFFFWASVHVLHQIIYITEMYNHRGRTSLTTFSRAADYAVILTSLYPLAAWKIYNNQFTIGLNNLSETIRQIFATIGIPWGTWMVWLAGGAFAISLVLWLVKTVMEWREGMLNGPKTLFIGLTVLAAFWVPALGNLDTAFQGMNLWHSLQYLSLTWMLNNLRLKRGEMEDKPFIRRISEDGAARKYYLFNIGLTVADVLLAVLIFFVLRFALGFSFDAAFDRSYYIAVLSFLWIHYYHDHFLFTEPEVIG
ncbi:MAG: hypothetical protein Kow00124_06060 [Anaerolineae bacterium]